MHKLRLPDEDEVSGSPIVSHGRIYLPTGGRIVLLGKKDARRRRDDRAAEAARGKDRVATTAKPAVVQVDPVRSCCSSRARSSNSTRPPVQRARPACSSKTDAPPTFTLDGPGEIDAARHTSPPPADKHIGHDRHGQGRRADGQAADPRRAAAAVEVRLQRHAARSAASASREGWGAAVTWIGARYRHKIREVDGEA